MKPLLDGVCKSQRWVENANQTQLKPIIWYTSWYFSRGGGILHPLIESLSTPLSGVYRSWGNNGGRIYVSISAHDVWVSKKCENMSD